MPIADRFRSAWNAFRHVENAVPMQLDYSGGSSFYSGMSPSRPQFRIANERSIIGSIYTRLAIDVASVDYRHVSLDDQGRYKET